MLSTVQLVCALIMGILSVELFSRAWLGFLGVIAEIVLYCRKKRDGQTVLSRLGTYCGIALLCSLLLIFFFHLYLVRFGLGKTEVEQMFYFLSSCLGFVFILKDIGNRIDALFHVDQDDDDM